MFTAGDGTRMRPLTLATPKALLPVRGKPILKHLGEALPDAVTELIIVVGYLKEQIQAYCGTHFLGRPVSYVVQEKKTGTAHALKLCQPHLHEGKFLVLAAADDLIGKQALEDAVAYDRAIIVSENDHPEKFGVLTTNEDGTVKDFVEKPQHFVSNLVNTNSMVLDHHVFEYEPDAHSNGEFYLTTMVAKLARDYPVHTVRADFWFPIATPEDLQKAENMVTS